MINILCMLGRLVRLLGMLVRLVDIVVRVRWWSWVIVLFFIIIFL